MNYIRRANERGRVKLGWLDSRHSFSFGHYHDPNHMGFSVLRVINDDVVKPGFGFGEHGHKDMEIISYVISGSLAHKDSSGSDFVVPAGDIQRMSAGKGIRHSEFNPSTSEPVNFLQIWIMPATTGTEPSYDQKTVVADRTMTPLVNTAGKDGALAINQDVALYKLTLPKGEDITLETNGRWGYLHIIKGDITAGKLVFGAGDAFGLKQNQSAEITATDATEALWFDLPPALN